LNCVQLQTIKLYCMANRANVNYMINEELYTILLSDLGSFWNGGVAAETGRKNMAAKSPVFTWGPSEYRAEVCMVIKRSWGSLWYWSRGKGTWGNGGGEGEGGPGIRGRSNTNQISETVVTLCWK
jgi:hypothetical protein